MPPSAKRSRPATNRAATNQSGGNLNQDSGSILADLDDRARHVDGTFVVVVEVTGGKYRRRCYLTAAAAEKAAARATERGENATVYLAELRPLWRVEGGGDRG